MHYPYDVSCGVSHLHLMEQAVEISIIAVREMDPVRTAGKIIVEITQSVLGFSQQLLVALGDLHERIQVDIPHRVMQFLEI